MKREIIGVLVAIMFWLLGIYIGAWLLFIKPLTVLFVLLGTGGTITFGIVVLTIIKVLLAGAVGWLIACIGTLLGRYIIKGRQ